MQSLPFPMFHLSTQADHKNMVNYTHCWFLEILHQMRNGRLAWCLFTGICNCKCILHFFVGHCFKIMFHNKSMFTICKTNSFVHECRTNYHLFACASYSLDYNIYFYDFGAAITHARESKLHLNFELHHLWITSYYWYIL